MRRQVLGALGRAVFFQIAPRRHQHAPAFGDAPPFQRGILRLTQEERKIDAIGDDVDIAIRQPQPQLDPGYSSQNRGTSGAISRRPRPKGAVTRKALLAFAALRDADKLSRMGKVEELKARIKRVSANCDAEIIR